MDHVMSPNINQSIGPYLDTSYEDMKHYDRFQFVKRYVGKQLRRGSSFLDIGCAKGEFIYCLKENYPDIFFTGLDISQELISIANNEPKLHDVVFIVDDAQSFSLNKRFDVVHTAGLFSIFDDYENTIRQIVKHLKSEGYGYIFGCFNDDDVDVLVRMRNNFRSSTEWESGLNLFSLATILKVLNLYSNEVTVYKFSLSIDLPYEPNSGRSYTLNTLERGKIILNSAKVLTDFFLIEFKNI